MTVLKQQHEDGWHLLAFISRSLKSAKKNYFATELKCQGIVWAITKLRHYLYGRSFTAETEHIAVQWSLAQPEPAGRLYRWILKLREYDFTKKYLLGRENVVADALSRAPMYMIQIYRSTILSDDAIQVAQENMYGHNSV